MSQQGWQQEDANATVISVHSRKGGAGKTSIILATALQLAAQGRRVAILDLDTLGTHLSQMLPLDRDLAENTQGQLRFQPDAFTSESVGIDGEVRSKERPKYSRRPTINTFLNQASPSGSVFPDEQADNLLDDIAAHLVISNLQRGRYGDYDAQIQKVCANLGLFLGSCYVTDVDATNQLTVSGPGQIQLKDRIRQAIERLDHKGYEYIFLDNPQGLSFTAAVNIEGALAMAKTRRVRTWFVSGGPWWEMALIVYELNVYRQAISSTRPTLIANRIGDAFLDNPEFAVGKHKEISPGEDIMAPHQDLITRMFCAPIWLAGTTDTLGSWEQFIAPNNLSVVSLSDDDSVKRSMQLHVDFHKAGDSLPQDDPLTKELLLNVPIYMGKFWSAFAMPALKACHESDAGAPLSHSFHENIYSALVKKDLRIGQETATP